MTSRRLIRSKDRWIAGVCGGIAEFFGWESGAVRSLWVFTALITAVLPGILVYGLFWWFMPPPRGFDLEDFRRE